MVIVLTVVALLYGNILSHIKNLNIFEFSNNYIFIFVSTFIIMGISMFIHEISHGVVAYKYGLIPKQLVVSLYLYISPIVYLKIPGIYTVNPKTRVKIWSAGIVSNLFLASLSIIIYNIIMKNYLVAFGLICLYILVQIVREILEAKFLGNKLDIHPLVIFISIYVGVKIFGILGILVGPMYSIIAKEVIYSEIK